VATVGMAPVKLSLDHVFVPVSVKNVMSIVRDSKHSDGAPTIEGTGIGVKDVAVAHEHSG